MKFSELKQKEVVNVLDGRRLGTTIDIEFSQMDGHITAIVVPGPFSFMNLIKGNCEGYVIPMKKICKIGDDVVLVELDASFFRTDC